MNSRTEKAVFNHKNKHSCSSAIMCAFRDETGLTEEQAKKIAAPLAGGKMIKCGAVLAAEYIIMQKFGNGNAEEKIAELEKIFAEKNKSLTCRELKGSLTGKPLRSCRGCVEDAAEILEKILKEEN